MQQSHRSHQQSPTCRKRALAYLGGVSLLALSTVAAHADPTLAELAAELRELKASNAQMRAENRQMKAAISEMRGQRVRGPRGSSRDTAERTPAPALPTAGSAVPVMVTADKRLQVGGITITPGGFLAGESVFRSKTTNSDINSAWNSIPYAALGSAVSSLFQMPGTLNVSVASMRTDSVGIARTEQIGVSKVTNVGQSFTTQVGNAWGLTVGQTAATNIGQTEIVQVGQTSQEQIGQTKTIMAGQTIGLGAGQTITLAVGQNTCNVTLDQSGTLTLQASNQIVLKGGGASLTVGPSVVLYSPSLVQGSAQPSSTCLQAMAADSVPFVEP